MFKVSKLNAKDIILDEIHAIQETLHNKETGFTWDAKRKMFDTDIKDFEKRHGIKLNIISGHLLSSV